MGSACDLVQPARVERDVSGVIDSASDGDLWVKTRKQTFVVKKVSSELFVKFFSPIHSFPGKIEG